MVKMIYLMSVLLLVGAGLLLWDCAMAWAETTVQGEEGVSDLASLRTTPHPGNDSARNVTPPLVEQATAFARYLQPPAPPAPKEAPKPQAAATPVPRPPTATPQFRLLATSYCPSSPEKSLALIAEPGKGDRWTRPGEHLGHFVIESIENGTVVYRDGNQRREMVVTMKESVELARLASAPSASARNITPHAGFLIASQPNEGGIGLPGDPTPTYDHE